MLFERDKKLNQALEKALAMKKQGKSNAEIIKLFPNCQSELESLLETAAVVEKGRDNILPDENVLRKILARMDQVTADDAARYSFTEESSEANFIGNLLSNFNQAFMSKKVYVGAVAAVFLLAIIVGVGWYNFSRSPEEISLATLENGVDELDAEFAYLTELSNDPFADLDGDLQMISGLTNGKTEGAEESTPA
ncbi:hypothetical protein HZB94_04845, partial [Candidatus Falkowbacteria bacterium]|nr:hypothetical protein [Candidatus Falkowbacteria bacterium]